MLPRFGQYRYCSPSAVSRRVAATARFSRCARRPDQQTAKPQPETTEQAQAERDQAGDEQAPKRRGLTLPAFALFAVGAPLGWYLSQHYNQAHRLHADSREFVKYTLTGKDSVSSTCAIFTLKPASNVTMDLYDPALERTITSIEFKQPQLQIARSYTCLPQEEGQDVDELRFLIRREQKGEVSNFLHRLPVGSEIEVRGLHPEYNLPIDVKSAIFLVGGTGIAPAIQAADIIDGHGYVHILWASRRREDCIGGSSDTTRAKTTGRWWSRPATNSASADRNIAHAEKGVLVATLESLKRRPASSTTQTPRLLVDYYVDEEGASIKPEEVRNALNALSRSDEEGKRIIFVSGPEGFINHWAGSKQWANGQEVQGPLRGVLSTMDLKGWEVVKL